MHILAKKGNMYILIFLLILTMLPVAGCSIPYDSGKPDQDVDVGHISTPDAANNANSDDQAEASKSNGEGGSQAEPVGDDDGIQYDNYLGGWYDGEHQSVLRIKTIDSRRSTFELIYDGSVTYRDDTEYEVISENGKDYVYTSLVDPEDVLQFVLEKDRIDLTYYDIDFVFTRDKNPDRVTVYDFDKTISLEGDNVSDAPVYADMLEAAHERGMVIYNEIKDGKRNESDLSDEEKILFEDVKAYFLEPDATRMPWETDLCAEGDTNYILSDKIETSSMLQSLNDIDYNAENCEDGSLKTAWVEGVSGNGIGEYVSFRFDPYGCRVFDVTIYNGYAKSEQAYQDNSRVKKLMLHINDYPYAVVNLKDTSAPQRITIDPVQSINMNQDLVLKFEIMEVYPGKKYEDTAITEINFESYDFYCLAEGTLVTMADGSQKPIELINKNVLVMGYDDATGCLRPSRVKGVVAAVHDRFYEIMADDGTSVTATPSHPFFVEGKGWCSLDPDETKTCYGYNNAGLIEEGDNMMVYQSGSVCCKSVREIRLVKKEMKSYAITGLEGCSAYFANGMATGVE